VSAAEEPLPPTRGWVAEHAARYLSSDGVDGHLWRGAPTLLLTTRGRRSGRLRRTPLIYGRDGDAYVVVGSWGGAPRHPSWYLNLSEDPEVGIQVGSEKMAARASTAEGAGRDELWSRMTEIWPDYDKYQQKTARRIPIVVLEPVTS
jgi:deazaflavin-dependent oxidoreductase (nitroreductase family)